MKNNTLHLIDKIVSKRTFKKNSNLPYTTKIIMAGALIPDTKALLSCWNINLSIHDNLQRARQENLLGKSSRSRVEDILVIFRQRYFTEDTVALSLAHLVKNKCNGNILEQILYFYTIRADPLLKDVVLELLIPQWSRGIMDINVREIQLALKEWVEEGKTSGTWSDYTISRAVRGVLSTLRDFGILQGLVKKRIAPAYLTVQAFSYIAFYLKQHQLSGSKLLSLDDWKLFFLPREGVERYFMEAHQLGLLEYHVAGSVTRLTFPVSSLEEYANVLTQ